MPRGSSRVGPDSLHGVPLPCRVHGWVCSVVSDARGACTRLAVPLGLLVWVCVGWKGVMPHTDLALSFAAKAGASPQLELSGVGHPSLAGDGAEKEEPNGKQLRLAWGGLSQLCWARSQNMLRARGWWIS